LSRGEEQDKPPKPQTTHLYTSRRHGPDTDAHLVAQAGQRAHKGGEPVLAGVVERRADAGAVAGDAAHVDEAAGHAVAGPVAEGELAEADGVGQVDVEHGVRVDGAGAAARWVPRRRVRVGGAPGRPPEVRPLGLEQARARHHDVDARERGHAPVQQRRQLRPRPHVRLLEQRRRPPRLGRLGVVRKLVEQLLRVGPQAEVADEDRAAPV
jgi:hypothetical protein